MSPGTVRCRRAPGAGLAGALLVAFLAAFPARALDPGKALTQYVHESWSIEQGLPQVTAREILQSRDGYLWFGTQEGLVRFDGVRFTVFDTGNTPALGGNGINALAEDRDGTIWIGRDDGLSRYRDGEMAAVDLDDGLSRLPGEGVRRKDVVAILPGRNGDLWFAVHGGLLRYRDGVFAAFTVRDGLADETVTALLEGRDGSLWIGTRAGLSRLKDGRISVVRAKDGLPGDHVASLAEDPDGSLWIGTTRGLARMRDGVVSGVPEAERLPSARVEAVLRDRDGNLWVGTVPSGLSRLKNGVLSTLAGVPGLSDDSVVSLLEDREGSLWIGTTSAGLHRFRDGKLTPFGKREGLSSDMTTGLWEGADGSLWIGASAGGVDRLKDGKVTTISVRDGLPADDVSTLAGARDGGLWIGTQSGGLARLKDGRVSRHVARDGLTGDTVRALLEDRNGILWIGGNLGLTRLEGREATRLGVKDGLAHATTISLAEDRDGTLWVGSAGGLRRLRDGRVLAPGPEKGLDGLSHFDLHADPDGTLWVGTMGHGLGWLRGGALATVTAADGLFNGTVLRVLGDGLGNLWLSCNKGIFRVRKSELEAFARGELKRVSSVAFGVPDGMRSAECNRGGGIRTRDGRLWFSTVRGLVSIDPARLRKNELPPPVVLEEVRADGTRSVLARGAPLSFPPGTRSLEVQYTATSLLVPERVRFRTVLEGFDRDWVDAGTRRTAYFNGLPPGAYTFRVRACNDDGVWNETGASLSFTLEPHPWQTRWFLALEILAAAALLGVGFRAQRHRLERKRLAELRRADLKRKTEELEYARKVQLALLPKEPWRTGPYEVAGETRTATEVGGDYFGYFPAGPGRFAVVVGDATGHGVAAGLVVGMAKAVLSTLRLGARTGGPADWLRELNGALKASVAQRGLGMCLGLAHVETETGGVRLGIAGVPHSFHWRAGRGALERLELSAPPLGYLSRIDPATAELELEPGDRLVLLTDGLIEQRNGIGQMWDYDGIEKALAPLCAGGLPAMATARALLDACATFASGAPLDDDQTIVVVARSAG